MSTPSTSSALLTRWHLQMLPSEIHCLIFQNLRRKDVHVTPGEQPTAISLVLQDDSHWRSRTLSPGASSWTTLSRNMRSLTIDTSNLTSTILSDHDRFGIENLRKLNVMKHVCLDSPWPRGNAPSNRHWLHDLAAKNPRLKALALVGFSAQAGAFDPVNARFRISEYFNFASPN